MVEITDLVMGKKQLSSVALSLWLMIIIIFMLFAHDFDFQIFFVLGFMGVLAIAELVGPRYVRPGLPRYIRYLVAAGIVIFGAIVIQNVMKILAH